MQLDARLLEILVCPACGSDVDFKERRKLIVCLGCERHFPVVDGIPIMVLDDVEEPSR